MCVSDVLNSRHRYRQQLLLPVAPGVACVEGGIIKAVTTWQLAGPFSRTGVFILGYNSKVRAEMVVLKRWKHGSNLVTTITLLLLHWYWHLPILTGGVSEVSKARPHCPLRHVDASSRSSCSRATQLFSSEDYVCRL